MRDKNYNEYRGLEMRHLVGMSGGKDSLATTLHAIERDIDFTSFFTDTGNEHEITYEYLDYLETKLGIKIQRVHNEVSENQWEKRRRYIRNNWGKEGIARNGQYRRGLSEDGRMGVCKICVNIRSMNYYNKNKDKMNEQRRENHSQNPQKYSETRAKYQRSKAGKAVQKKANEKFFSTEKGRLSSKKSQDRYKEKNKQKLRCHWSVKSALKSGKLIKMPCTVCGVEKSEAHHPDYTKPLDVIWLCCDHHKELHRKH